MRAASATNESATNKGSSGAAARRAFARAFAGRLSGVARGQGGKLLGERRRRCRTARQRRRLVRFARGHGAQGPSALLERLGGGDDRLAFEQHQVAEPGDELGHEPALADHAEAGTAGGVQRDQPVAPPGPDPLDLEAFEGVGQRPRPAGLRRQGLVGLEQEQRQLAEDVEGEHARARAQAEPAVGQQPHAADARALQPLV
jgi:hypothetical protein